MTRQITLEDVADVAIMLTQDLRGVTSVPIMLEQIGAARDLTGGFIDRVTRHGLFWTGRLGACPEQIIELFITHGRLDGRKVVINDPAIARQVSDVVNTSSSRWASDLADVIYGDMALNFEVPGSAWPICGSPPPVAAWTEVFDFDRSAWAFRNGVPITDLAYRKEDWRDRRYVTDCIKASMEMSS